MKKCYSCKKEINISGKPTRNDICENCGAYLRVCLNCRFFNESSHNKCKEPQAEWIADKEKANYCDYFIFMDTSSSDSSENKEDARKKFDDLFNL